MDMNLSKNLVEAVENDDIDGAAKLLAEGANPNLRNSRGEPLLCIATANYSIGMAKLLLEHGASALAKVHRMSFLGEPEDQSALELAVSLCNAELVELIADAALKTGSDQARESVLEGAVEYGLLDLATMAIERGCDANDPGLMRKAIMRKNANMVRLLLDHGADVNMAIESGPLCEVSTPLHLAVKRGDIEVVKVILDAKPRPDATDEHDITAYDLAVVMKKKEIVALLENSGIIHSKRHRRSKESEFIPERITDTNFASVVGLEHVKQAIYRDLLYPLRHQELAKDYGVEVQGGMILFGPPGCGKTLIVRAMAGESNANIIEVRPSDIYDAYVGSEGRHISRLFHQARNNVPCIIFIDEVELLGTRRESTGNYVWMREALTTFLTELDGLQSDNNGILVVGATNEPWTIDPALKRHGRLGKMLYVPPPDESMREGLFRLYLRDAPLAGEIDYRALAKASGLCNSADIAGICREARQLGWGRTVETGKKDAITMGDILACMQRGKSNLAEWYETAKRSIVTDGDRKLYSELVSDIAAYENGLGAHSQSYR